MALITNVAMRWYTYAYDKGIVSFSNNTHDMANTNNRGPCYPSGAVIKAMSNRISGSTISAGGSLLGESPLPWKMQVGLLSAMADMRIGTAISNASYPGRQQGDVIVLSSEESTISDKAGYEVGMMLDGYYMMLVTNISNPVGNGINIVDLDTFFTERNIKGIDYYRTPKVTLSLEESGFKSNWVGDSPKHLSSQSAKYIASYLEAVTPAGILNAKRDDWLRYMRTSCYNQSYADTLPAVPGGDKNAYAIGYNKPNDDGYGLFNLEDGEGMTIREQIDRVLLLMINSPNGITNSGVNNNGIKTTIGSRRIGDPTLRMTIAEADEKEQEAVSTSDHPARQTDAAGNTLLYAATQYVEVNSMLLPLHLPTYFNQSSDNSTSVPDNGGGTASPISTGTGDFMKEAVNYDFKLTIDKVVDWIIQDGKVGRFNAWCNNNRTKCKQVLEAVQGAGMSAAWFAAYEKAENGNGLASVDYGGTMSWLNSRYIGGQQAGEPALTGDPVNDARATVQIMLKYTTSSTPAGGFGVDITRATEAMKALPSPSIGRLYVACTAAAAAELINQDIGYGKPMAHCASILQSIGGVF